MAEAGRPDPSAQEARHGDRLAFTLDADTGEILKYEAVDAAGGRRELSQNERLELAKIRRGEAVEDLVERGFEAGLACLLGGADGPEDESETDEDASFRRALLRPLIEKSVVARALRRDVLRRAIVRSLISDVLGSAEPETKFGENPEGGSEEFEGLNLRQVGGCNGYQRTRTRTRGPVDRSRPAAAPPYATPASCPFAAQAPRGGRR